MPQAENAFSTGATVLPFPLRPAPPEAAGVRTLVMAGDGAGGLALTLIGDDGSRAERALDPVAAAALLRLLPRRTVDGAA